jgi:hypothetical protein
MKSKLFCSLVILLGFFEGCYCQISFPGKPYSQYNAQMPLGRQKNLRSRNFRLPSINNLDEIRNADRIKQECPTCRSDYYGKGIDVTIDLIKEGQKTVVENGTLWKFTFTSETALGMQFYFSKYKLPKKASLFVYNGDYSQILGAFTHANNHVDEKFAIQVIYGSEITLEYFESNDAEFPGTLGIYKVIHVFKESIIRDVSSGRIGDGASCNIDVNCSDGIPYSNEKKSVCRISYYDPQPNLTAHCSGFLINNNQFIRKPYVLTADHCIKTNNPESATTPVARHHEWIFEFDYEKTNCGPGGIEPITHSVQGATLVTRGVEADYALLDLQINNLESWVDVAYLGWDKRDVNFSSTASIHHPQGDVKKIALDYNSVLSVFAQNGSNTFCCVNATGFPKTHWQVTWDKGITEPGSSGSPLINQGSKLAIGILSAGSSNCTSGGPDYYGRLAHAWNTYDYPYYFPLGHYLDPNNSTQILTSYIPNFVQTEGSSEGGGGTGSNQLGSVPNWTGVILNPTHLLGDFSDLDDKNELCSGNYTWSVAHGDPIVSPKKYIQLLSENHTLNNRYSSAIVRNFQFVKNKEYVLSFEVYDPHAGFPSTDYLEAFMGNNITIYGCNTSRYSMVFSGQQILKLNYDRYKDSNGESKWYTFAIKFIPNDNYSSLYLRHVPKGPIDSFNSWAFASALIDRVGIHEKGDFNNPQCVDDKTVNNSNSINNVEMANVSITAIKGASSFPIITNGRNVKFTSKSIYLKDGFSVARGASFYAGANDCIDITNFDNPIGPLDHNVVSALRSTDHETLSSYSVDYNYLPNLYNYRQDNLGNAHSLTSRKRISLTPNPAAISVSIRCEDLDSNYSVLLKDVSGKLIFETKATNGSAEILLEGYAKGIYIIQVSNGNSIYYDRLVIE